jgi:cytidine deaminase
LTSIKLTDDEKNLLRVASRAMKSAYVMWGASVGAAVLAEDGKAYEGCNVESRVSGLGLCAERNAINHAVVHGNRKIKGIAVVTRVGDHSGPKPCGACLQYIHDFAQNPETKIIMAETKDGKVLFGRVEIRTLRELLPFPHER